jgi:hypothetical protein
MGIEIGDDRAGFGAEFAAEGVRIGLEREKISVGAENFVFVDGAFADFGEKEFPDAGRAAWTHGMHAAVPAIHNADDADAFCGGGPDGEVGSGNSSDGVEMRAEFFVGVEMAAFAEKVEIEIGEEKREGVRIENFERFAGVGAELNFIAAGLGSGGLIGWPDRLEEAFGAKFDGVGNFCRRDGGILEWPSLRVWDADRECRRDRRYFRRGGNWRGRRNRITRAVLLRRLPRATWCFREARGDCASGVTGTQGREKSLRVQRYKSTSEARCELHRVRERCG